MDKKSPKQCKKCTYFWTHGIKDNIHNRWCTHFGKSAYKSLGQCNLVSAFKVK